MKLIAFIPARLESKRFPNKVLKLIYGIPMIEHVRRRALFSGIFENTYIVSNSKIIKKKLNKFNPNIIITKKKHHNGTSRTSEVSTNYNFDYAFILFADEPFINPFKIKKCKQIIKNNNKIDVFNVVTNLKNGDLKATEVVKCVLDKTGNILDYYRNSSKYRSVEKIKKSSGILILKKKIIDNYKFLKTKKNERNISVEQFRFLENNIKVKSIYLKDLHPSINTKEEMKKLISIINSNFKEKKLLSKIKKIEN